MTDLSHRLMTPTEKRPGNGVSDGSHLLPAHPPDQAQHLWQRGRDQPATNPLRHLKLDKLLGPCCGFLAFFFCLALACSVIRVAQNWASRARVTCMLFGIEAERYSQITYIIWTVTEEHSE
jgi:hypothetical protein